MTSTANARTHRTLMAIKRVWREMDHAQRRLIELQTGQSTNR